MNLREELKARIQQEQLAAQASLPQQKLKERELDFSKQKFSKDRAAHQDIVSHLKS